MKGLVVGLWVFWQSFMHSRTKRRRHAPNLDVTPHKEYERMRQAVLEQRDGLGVGLALVVVATVVRALHCGHVRQPF